jgi:hypothetical protein
MIMRARMAVLLAVTLVSVGACGGAADETATGDEDLTQGGKALIGAYVERGAGQFRALVLTGETVSPSANRFFADIDTGVRCIQAPCPSQERVEGTFTGGTKTLTLRSDTASEAAKVILAKYNHQLVGSKLSLSRAGGFQQSLEKVDSYCGEETKASDCDAQGIVHAQCAGGWTCSAASTCSWSCAGPTTPPNFCVDGNVVAGADAFVPSADGKECKMPSIHCLTKDAGACPQLSPLPPDFCADGTIVKGAPTFVVSADGKECQLPSAHCTTSSFDACPQLSPLPPDYCADGTVERGTPRFTASSDGKECQLPSVHCVTKDAGACPQF